MTLQLNVLKKCLGKQHQKKAYLEMVRERASWVILHYFYLWDSLDLSSQGCALLYFVCARMKLRAKTSWHWIKYKKGLEQEIKYLG